MQEPIIVRSELFKPSLVAYWTVDVVVSLLSCRRPGWV